MGWASRQRAAKTVAPMSHVFTTRPRPRSSPAAAVALDFGLRVRVDGHVDQATLFSGAENFSLQQLTSELRVRSFAVRYELDLRAARPRRRVDLVRARGGAAGGSRLNNRSPDTRMCLVASLTLVVALGSALAASDVEPTPEFRHLSVAQGLSHGSVYSILQDATGFMWFATEDGLNRYDGARITVYRHEPGNPDSLATSNFGEIHEDRSGVLWLGTWGGGLDRFDTKRRRFTHHRHQPGNPASLSADRIEVVLEDSRGQLWIGTERAGLNRFDPATGRFIRYRHDPQDARSLASDEVRALREDSSGTLWVGTNGGLSRFDRASGSFSHYRHDPLDPGSLASDRVRAVLADRSGTLWVGTRGGGLARLDRKTGRFERFRHDADDPGSLSDDAVSCLAQDSFGTLWIGTYSGGLNRFDTATRRFVSYRHDGRDPKGLSNDYVEVLYEDRAQNLWIGTRGGGVDRLDLKPAKFRSELPAPADERGRHPSSVRALAESGGGQEPALWIASDGGGLVRYDRQRRSFRRFRHRPDDVASLSSDRVWSVIVDRRGAVWAGTYEDGLDRLVERGGAHRITRYRHDPADPASLGDDRIQAMLEDGQGRLWLGTSRGLAEVLRSATGEVSGFRTHRHEAQDAGSLSHDYVSVIRQDRAGALWIGTRGGLNRLDPASGRFSAFRHRPDDSASLTNDFVYDLREDLRQDGVLWVATEGGGLDRFDSRTGRSRRHSIGGGAASRIVDAILQDEAGQLWLSTSAGLSRFDPERGTFREYGNADGIEGHSFVRGSALAARDGVLYFGGKAGTTWFDPRLVRDNPHVPAVALTALRVFGEERLDADALVGLGEIELSHRDNFVSLEFAALDFTAPGKNQYAYRLEGVDPDWVQAGNRSFANYTNLDPGHYEFRVKAANDDGVWNEQGTALRVIVTPALWQTWWFRLVAALGLALAIGLVHRARIVAVRSRNQELQRINVALNREVDERKRAEANGERLIAELEVRNSEMERFVYTVSHDLKSPVITIKGFLGLARQGVAKGDTEGATRDLSRVEAAADRMHRLLNELLEFSRVSRAAGTPVEVDLRQLAAEAVAHVAGPIADRGVRVDVAADLPVVLGDRARLLEVLQNLIENAVKFMGEQRDPRVRITSECEAGEAVVSVEDNGKGIDGRYAEKIFELFERLDHETEGTGIGLALVKRIVERHGGSVWVESDGPGCGSTFRFTLPLAAGAAPPVAGRL